MLKKIFLFLIDTLLAIAAFCLVVLFFVLKFDKIYLGIGLGCIVAYVLFMILRSTHSDNHFDGSGANKIGNNKQSYFNHPNAEKHTKMMISNIIGAFYFYPFFANSPDLAKSVRQRLKS